MTNFPFSEYWQWYVLFMVCALFVIWVVDFTSSTPREHENDIVLKVINKRRK